MWSCIIHPFSDRARLCFFYATRWWDLLQSGWPQPAVSVQHLFSFLEFTGFEGDFSFCNFFFLLKSWSLALFGSILKKMYDNQIYTTFKKCRNGSHLRQQLFEFSTFSANRRQKYIRRPVVVTAYFLVWLWNIKVKPCSTAVAVR